MLVRIVALALVGWTIAEIALYWVVCRHNNQPLEVLKIIVRALPLLIGVIVLIKAKSVAEWVSDFLDN